MQVRYVVMGREQSEVYRDAIEDYRAASKARLAKSSTGLSGSAVKFLPKRQISNYFTQFRKVPIFLLEPCMPRICHSVALILDLMYAHKIIEKRHNGLFLIL